MNTCSKTVKHTVQKWTPIVRRTVRKHLVHLDEVKPACSDRIISKIITQDAESIIVAHKLKYVQMKMGPIWQSLMGVVDGIEDLGNSDLSGLDLRSDHTFKHGKFVMELKNSIHTDNNSSRKYNLIKLQRFSSKYPEYQPIYGFVNDRTKRGVDLIKFQNGTNIRYLSGDMLLTFIFGQDEYPIVLDLLQQELSSVLTQKPPHTTHAKLQSQLPIHHHIKIKSKM